MAEAGRPGGICVLMGFGALSLYMAPTGRSHAATVSACIAHSQEALGEMQPNAMDTLGGHRSSQTRAKHAPPMHMMGLRPRAVVGPNVLKPPVLLEDSAFSTASLHSTTTRMGQ